MAFEPTLAVHGANGTAAQMRRFIYQSSGGARGITLPGDLRVTATGTPSGSVNIARGSGVAPLPSSWRPGESYMVANASADLFDIQATGSAGGRTEYVIVKVLDHNFDDSPEPADPENDNGAHVEVASVASLSNLNFPYVPLAKLTIPKSTATITNAMITDIRKVANPRREVVLRSNALYLTETETLTQTRDDGEFFPNAGGVQQIDIPSWATRCIIRWTLHSVRMPATNAWGRHWVGWGDLATATRRENNTQEFGYDTGGAGTAYRTDLSGSDDRYIPVAYRGRSQVQFNIFARKISGAGPVMDAMSGVSMEVTFLEVADASDS